MALEGTIKDFALPDIFQLIGIQKKTGILTLADGEDTVTLKFFEGQVVGTDTESMSLEDRLGQVLVRSGRIGQQQLDEALRTQKNTLQRLGYILVNSGYIGEDDLIEALRIQASQIIYRLFRWCSGSYHFEPVEDLEYDQRHFTPIGAETILMEGARMIDEWPIIERRIKNDRMVFRLAPAAAGLDLTAPQDTAEAADLEFDLGFEFDRQEEARVEPAAADKDASLTLTSDERRLLSLVDGKRTVNELCDLVGLGDFDTYRTLADLLTRNLIEEVVTARVREASSGRGELLGRVSTQLGKLAILAASLVSLATLADNRFSPWTRLAARPATTELGRYVSLSRLERIEQALEVFYLDTGTVPGTLATLAANRYVMAEDLVDPWGRPFLFQVSPGGWQLAAQTGEDGLENRVVTRSFNAAQQLLLDDSEEVSPKATD